jgi:hypothetical protein
LISMVNQGHFCQTIEIEWRFYQEASHHHICMVKPNQLENQKSQQHTERVRLSEI